MLTRRTRVSSRIVKPNSSSGVRVNLSLTVEDLPLEIAEQVQRAQASDPEMLRRVMVYAMTRNAVFETLSRRLPR
jgi:hypothetical protein